MSSLTLRTAVYIGGTCVAALGALGALARCFPAAGALALWALVLLLVVAVERWRYKPLSRRPLEPGWQATEERFVDPETGREVTVYFHRHTGERRYVAG